MLNGISRASTSLAGAPTPPPSKRRRLQAAIAEVLETRRLLADSANFASGVITVTLNHTGAETASVIVQGTAPNQTVQVTAAGSNLLSPAPALSSVTSISITN